MKTDLIKNCYLSLDALALLKDLLVAPCLRSSLVALFLSLGLSSSLWGSGDYLLLEYDDFDLASLPEATTDFVLPASDPAEAMMIDLTDVAEHGGTIAFQIIPYAATLLESEVFFDALGVSLGFISDEEGTISMAGYNPSTDEWKFKKLKNRDSLVDVMVSFNSDTDSYDVSVKGKKVFNNIPLAHASNLSEGFFFGNTEVDLQVMKLEISPDFPKEEIDSEEEASDEFFADANKLKNFRLPDSAIKMVPTGNTLHQLRNRFRDKLASLPEGVRNLPRDHIIFVDNEIGDDNNTGKNPLGKGSNGPKESIRAAIDAVPNGGAIVLMPGYGVYVEEPIGMKAEKSFSIIAIGDNHVGTERALSDAYDKRLMARPSEFKTKYLRALTKKRFKKNEN